jgi:ABC-type uncharacterized transport system ATPase subunit
VLSTHVLPDVAACCDTVAILHRGELRHVGPAAEPVSDVVQVGVARVVDAAQWSRLPMVANAQAIDATRWRVHLRAGAALDEFAAALVGTGIRVTELRADAAPLETIFFRSPRATLRRPHERRAACASRVAATRRAAVRMDSRRGRARAHGLAIPDRGSGLS